MSERSAERAPWWLEGGLETCGSCQGAYWIEVEVRCVACDRPGCIHCTTVVRATGEAWCRECGPEEETGRRTGTTSGVRG